MGDGSTVPGTTLLVLFLLFYKGNFCKGQYGHELKQICLKEDSEKTSVNENWINKFF